jgi:hypothetical protein
MATFTADEAAATAPAKGEGMSGNCKVVVAEYEISAALALNDVIQMVKVPNGAVVSNVVLATDDLDTHGTPTIVLDVGDGGDTDRYIDGATVGQAGGVTDSSNLAIGGIGYEYTDEDTIDILVQAAPATGATSGTLKLIVHYTI